MAASEQDADRFPHALVDGARAMSKLLQLKEWLTLPEAVKRLSAIFQEDVSESDILRLSLDGRMRLSVYLVNGAKARLGKVVGFDDVQWGEFSAEMAAAFPNLPEEQKGKPLKYVKSLRLDDDRYLNLDEDVTTIWGVWDLPMLAGDRHDVEHRFQMESGGPAVTVESLEGSFLERDDGVICQLMESYDDNEFELGSSARLKVLRERIELEGIPARKAKVLLDRYDADRKEFLRKRRERPHQEGYYPSGGLPQDCVFVVRMREILRLQAEVLGPSAVRPLGGSEDLSTKERTSLLVLVGLVAHLADLDLDELPKQVQAAAEEKGIQISRRTIEEKIKAVRAAMQDRLR